MSNTTKHICCERYYFIVVDFIYFSHCVKSAPTSFLSVRILLHSDWIRTRVSSTGMKSFYNLTITINFYIEKICEISPLIHVNKFSSNRVFSIFTISLNNIGNVFFSSTLSPNLRLIIYIVWFEVYIRKLFMTRKFLEYLMSTYWRNCYRSTFDMREKAN